jgi:hypothetical protein
VLLNREKNSSCVFPLTYTQVTELPNSANSGLWMQGGHGYWI